MDAVTLVVTSCARHDLLKQTLESFSRYNTYPIAETIIVEDSSLDEPSWLVSIPRLGNKTWVKNGRGKGQIFSIDRAYAEVKTPYIFHCEDDWRFLRSGFIENSLTLLKTNKLFWTVNLRADDCNRHPVKNGLLEPYWCGGWGGLSFNPGLRRLSDYQLLGSYGRYMGYGTHGFDAELALSRTQLDRGFRIASLPIKYVEHIGEGRSRAADPNYAPPKPPKVLIAIPACHSYKYDNHADGRIHRNGLFNARVEAVRDTWQKYMPAFAANVDMKFFYGRYPVNSEPLLKNDEVLLDVGDDYVSLPHKVKAIYQYALAHGYDYVFKGDDDTFIYVDRLIASGFENFDYTGYVTNDPNCPEAERYASGGSGYWVSKRAMEILASTPVGSEWAEDRWVGKTLRAHGIKPVRDARYLPGFWEHFVNVDAMGETHSYITAHACNPVMMAKLFSKTLTPNFQPVVRALHEESTPKTSFQDRAHPVNLEVEGIHNGKQAIYAADGLTIDWWSTHDKI